MAPHPRPGILEIDPYVPGKDHAPGAVTVHKLSSNESPLGPSPLAREALLEAVQGDLARYPDGTARVLREAIAEVHGLHPAHIACGNGSDELLAQLCHAYLAPGDEAIVTEHGFLIYKIQTLAAGGTPVTVAERDERVDVDAILAAVTPRTRLVFIANPGNPTGTYVPAAEIRRLQAALPADVLLVLDAAYGEYVRRNDYETGIELVSSSRNVIMTRTFSKVYGLAALRVGWAYGPAAVIDVLNRMRNPFNVGTPAMIAAAAAMRDRTFTAEAVRFNETWREEIAAALAALGLRVTPSVANFLLVHFPQTRGRSAREADAFLTARGFVLRGVGAYGFPDALRLSIGTEDANRGVIAAFRDFMGQA